MHNHTLFTHHITHRNHGMVYPMPARGDQKIKSPKETHVLVVDDEEPLRNLLRISLQKAGYTVYTAGNGKEAMELFKQSPVDLVLLDILMPDMDGYALCAELRRRSDVPIIMLSALNRPDDVVYGFSLGADDYIAKPFQFREVEVRIQAILRRVAWLKERPDFNIISHNEIVLDSEAHEVRVRGELVHLTPIEFQLLRYLMKLPDKPVSKNELFQSVWGYDLVGDTNLVEVAIRRLREKIEENPSEPAYLLTVRGTGYKFNTQGAQRHTPKKERKLVLS
jgi:two-component system, OmpR family, response regulator RpaB